MNAIRKIDRAKQHLNELQRELKTFFNSHPYRIGTKRDAQTKRLIYYVIEVKDTPDKLSLISGDIIQNLRSALDHLAYELFVKETSGKVSGRHIYFPIEKDAETYKREKGRKTKGISKEAVALIDNLKPYKGGNDILWRIHELNNLDKHRLLVTVGSSFGSFDVGAHMHELIKKSFPNHDFPSIPLFLRPADKLFPLKAGDELFSDAPEAQEIPDMQFRFEILLNEPGVVEGEILTEVLKSMIEEVDKLVPILKSQIL